MKPVQRKTRKAFNTGPHVSVTSVKDTTQHIDPEFDIEDTYNEDGELSFLGNTEDAEQEANKMTDEEIKIKSLNQAVNMAKLMSNVTVDDVINIAAKVAKFIKG